MVEWKKLGEVCSDVIVPMRDRPKVFDGTIPWCRIEDIEGMYFNRSLSNLMVSESVIKTMNLKVYPVGTVICSCSATLGVCAINTQPLITNQTFIGLVCSEQINNRFLYYYMTTRKKELHSLSTTGTIPYVSREKFEKMTIPIPSLSEQQRIVEQLDTFTSSIENLKQQIAQRRKQYEYYRDQLLDLEGKEGVEMKTLGESCLIRTGSKPAEILDKGRYCYINAGTTESGYVNESNCDCDVVTTPSRGQGGIGFVGYQRNDFWLGPLCYQIRPNKKENFKSKYLFYYLSSHSEEILKYKSEGGTPAVNAVDLKKIQIHLPPLQEQQRIVSILDTLEASIQNLEAQLSQREKQYEYYRNKLLTFE